MMNNGVFLIDKPANITSFQVVKKIRQITGEKKAGHTGTLDPFATGLLPICLGKATRISQFLLADTKTYEVKAKFGIKTNTGDFTGTTVQEMNKKITNEQMQSIIPKINEIEEQIPPAFSAIKINGRKAYQLARANQKADLAPREIKIIDFKLTNFEFPLFSYTAKVTKGTYIRTLTEQIAEMLGTIATTTELRRTEIGALSIHKSTSLEKITTENWKTFLFPIHEILPQFPVFELTENQQKDFNNGLSINVEEMEPLRVIIKSYDQMIIGMAEIENGILRPKMVFKED
jgi:tRNA pseudouridine55 synthase